ncbi:unnamed protein product [Schistocephalus solidus]|uniref:Uncharacterized protein n=1 Tax=Schistocephalus solidus TaxID=70667 RepID=A0A183T1N2_SCHSO|nr:unnamed protein product [Schistocephalus solidus]
MGTRPVTISPHSPLVLLLLLLLVLMLLLLSGLLLTIRLPDTTANLPTADNENYQRDERDHDAVGGGVYMVNLCQPTLLRILISQVGDQRQSYQDEKLRRDIYRVISYPSVPLLFVGNGTANDQEALHADECKQPILEAFENIHERKDEQDNRMVFLLLLLLLIIILIIILIIMERTDVNRKERFECQLFNQTEL